MHGSLGMIVELSAFVGDTYSLGGDGVGDGAKRFDAGACTITLLPSLPPL